MRSGVHEHEHEHEHEQRTLNAPVTILKGVGPKVAERLAGHSANDHLDHKAAELLHLRPCLATQIMDPQLGDTVMHESIRLMEAAARKGLTGARRG